MNAFTASTSGRLTLPILRQVEVRLSDAERARLSGVAERITADEPTLASFDVFGPDVVVGLSDAPALVFEDHFGIKLFSYKHEAAFRYRLLLLAGDGDQVLIGGHRDLAFEQYCRDVVGLGHPTIVTVPPLSRRRLLSLAERCATDQRAFKMVLDFARRQGQVNLIPYIGTGSAWKLAGQISAATGARVQVAAPPPRLTQRVNNKLWFDQRVIEVLGKEARPPNYHAFGPAAVAGRIAAIARRSERVVVKIPDSAGSAGNIVLDSATVRRFPVSQVRRQILSLLHSRGWRSEFPLLVGVWDCAVLSSPSVQVWVPLADQGLPVIEGIFEQLVRGVEGEFIGATTSQLPEQLRQQIASEAMQFAFLFQKLGYFGRCSLDAIVVGSDWGSAAVRWIECNGRWGGTSIPMTLMNRLTGDWTRREIMIVQRQDTKARRYQLPTVLDRLGNLLYRHDGDGTGVIVTNPGQLGESAALNLLLLGHDATHVQEQLLRVQELFQDGLHRSGDASAVFH
ncbi:MAG: hypothetical protein JSU95_07380 [Betaproteobacteria bacterium]|nr:MAG: hypothetical protein JSU95_07380 [Betaproteobacteria bacterium]